MARAAAAAHKRSAPRTAPRRVHRRHADAGAPQRVSGGTAGAVALPRPAAAPRFARALRSRGAALLDTLLSGRGWIALVFVLLAGIVFFNVDLLQMNRDIARNAERISALKRENSRLRAEAAVLGSSERIQEEAAKLGLVLPAPGEVRYRRARAGDARRAARKITEPVPTLAPAPVWTPPTPPADATGITDATGLTDATGTTGTGVPAAPTTGVTDTTGATSPTGTTTPATTGVPAG